MKKKLYFCDFENFGDALSPYLMRHLMKCNIVPATAANADIMAVGSLFFTGEYFFFDRSNIFSRQALKWLWYKLKGLWKKPLIVWGSAFLHEPRIPRRCLHFRKLDIRAVRGEKTKRLLQRAGFKVSDDVALGDPGLFYPELLGDYKSIKKRFDVAVVPGFNDRNCGALLREKLEGAGYSAIFVDVMQKEPLDVLREIASAKCVVASAMHAMIVSDSMGIPNLLIRTPDANPWKIEDYYSSYGLFLEKILDFEACLLNPKVIFENMPSTPFVSAENVRAVKIRLLKALEGIDDYGK